MSRPAANTKRRQRGPKTVSFRRPQKAGAIPIDKFFIDIKSLDRSPIVTATGESVELPTDVAVGRDYFLEAVGSTEKADLYAEKYVELQMLKSSTASVSRTPSQDKSVSGESDSTSDDASLLAVITIPIRYTLECLDSPKPVLVLDLDATLFYSSTTLLDTTAKMVDHGFAEAPCRYVYYRPYVTEFLQWAKQHFELIVWTAGMKEYAHRRLCSGGMLDFFDNVLYRDECSYLDGYFIKDLSRLDRNQDDILIIDDNPISFSLNPELAVPIPAFEGDGKDTELLKLIPLLRKVLKLKNVRVGMRRVFFENSVMHPAYERASQDQLFGLY